MTLDHNGNIVDDSGKAKLTADFHSKWLSGDHRLKEPDKNKLFLSFQLISMGDVDYYDTALDLLKSVNIESFDVLHPAELLGDLYSQNSGRSFLKKFSSYLERRFERENNYCRSIASAAAICIMEIVDFDVFSQPGECPEMADLHYLSVCSNIHNCCSNTDLKQVISFFESSHRGEVYLERIISRFFSGDRSMSKYFSVAFMDKYTYIQKTHPNPVSAKQIKEIRKEIRGF